MRRNDGQWQDGTVPVAARGSRHRRRAGDLHRSQGRSRQSDAHVSRSRAFGLRTVGGRGRRRAQRRERRRFRREDGGSLEKRPRGMGPGSRTDRALVRRRRGGYLHAGRRDRAAIVRAAFFLAPFARVVSRRGSPTRSRGLCGLGFAEPAPHRSRPHWFARAHSALEHSRRRVAPGLVARHDRPHPGRAKTGVRQAGCLRPRDLLPGEGSSQARNAAEQPHRLARLRHLDAWRAARRAAPLVHGRWQAAHFHHLHRDSTMPSACSS